jgi:uncharacterized membrane protein YdjX (TVP38/TMEM64 family)
VSHNERDFKKAKLDEVLRKAKLDRTKLAVILVIALVFILIVILILSRTIDGIQAYLLSTGKFGLVIYVALYGLLGASPIPSEPLTVLLSALCPLRSLLYYDCRHIG